MVKLLIDVTPLSKSSDGNNEVPYIQSDGAASSFHHRRLNATGGTAIIKTVEINETYWILFLCILGVILLICLGIATMFFCKI